MEEKIIKPTTEKEEYILSDEGYFFIEALRELTTEIKKLRKSK